MKKGYLFIVFLLTLFAFTEQTPMVKAKFKLPSEITSKDYLPNNLVIKFKEGTRLDIATQSAEKELSANGISLTLLEPIFNSGAKASQASTNDKGFHFENYYHAKYQGNAKIETVINTLLQNESIAYVEPSYIHSTWYTPNDASYGSQFYLPQVKAPQAWDVLKNSSNVIIGIVDSGSETTHPDLAANIYYNTADPINGIDDDGDGYIDNYAGWDFCGASATTMIGDNDPNVKSHGAEHGVHVSGIASAASDNGVGVASLAYNAKLLIVKTGADDNGTSIYKGYEGIKYAADKGAHIINCSWGGAGGGQFGQEMVNYAISKGCLVVAAAGNSGDDNPVYPAAFEGVLAVANVNPNDTKYSGSNYGTYVDLSAPGQGIYNTIYNNSYGYYSGTSMSAPLVSSAAALVKAKYPNYTGLQIGEILRTTADNIDALNPNYVNLLGKGRLNILRALTENPASVRTQSVSITDQSLGNRAPNTEITMQFALKNFLIPVTGLTVNITSNSAFVQVVDQNISAGNFTSLETKTGIGPVRVKVLAGAPENHEVILTLKYTGNNGTYLDSESFKTVVALDYLNISVNKINTTFTSNGRIGYSKANAVAGLGFMYKDENMLFEAALLVAKSETQVMNNARASAASSEDFKRQQTAAMVSSSTAAFEGTSVFTDAGSTNPLGLSILSRALAFNSTADEKYVIMEYEITNTSNADLQNIYTGLFTDWDLDDASANATQYDAITKTAYVYAKKNAAYPYAGIRLLSLSTAPAYYPLSYQLPNSLLADNNFTVAEKYQTLTSGIQATGLGHDNANGYDVMFTVGSGPYNIAKNGTVKVAYAFVAGDNLSQLATVGGAAELKYKEVLADRIKSIPVEYALKQNYPNQAKTFTYIPLDLPEKTNVDITIYDVTGRKVSKVTNGTLNAGSYRFYVDVSKFANGVYTYQLKTSNYKQAKKMIVSK
ncbi:Thermophilic serine proteinase precursor [compost metagenome]